MKLLLFYRKSKEGCCSDLIYYELQYNMSLEIIDVRIISREHQEANNLGNIYSK